MGLSCLPRKASGLARRALKSLSGRRVGEARQFDPWKIPENLEGKHGRLVRCFLVAKKASKKLYRGYILGMLGLNLKLDVVAIRINNYNPNISHLQLAYLRSTRLLTFLWNTSGGNIQGSGFSLNWPMGQIIATSHDRFPPKCTVLEGKWDPLFQRIPGWWNTVSWFGQIAYYRDGHPTFQKREPQKFNGYVNPYDWVW